VSLGSKVVASCQIRPKCGGFASFTRTYQALVAVPLGGSDRWGQCARARVSAREREAGKENVRIRWESLDFGGGLGLATEERKEGQ
jgi:hypothetical protein